MYRPITHAPAVGKHLEKLAQKFLNSVDDGNATNHAYVAQHNIFTAITELIATIQKVNRLNEILRETHPNEKIVVVICFEDISGAFESLHHVSMVRCVNRMNNLQTLGDNSYKNLGCKIDKLCGSYLNRNASVYDENGNSLKVNLRAGRSTPQGSSKSPKFWRIHDRIYAKIHQDFMKKIVATDCNVAFFRHLSFADDQASILGIRVPHANPRATNYAKQFTENSYNINRIIATCRRSLNLATNTCGSQIEPTKTEIIVNPDLVNFTVQGKSTWKWLGYTFSLDNNSKITITDTQLIRRTVEMKKMVEDIYGYIPSYKARFSIFRTWVNPVIEFFSLKQLFESSYEQSLEKSILEKFQHYCLTAVCNFGPQGNRKTDLRKLLKVKSISDKVQRFCRSISSFKPVATKIQYYKNLATTVQQTTRAGVSNVFTSKINPKNNIYLKIHLFASRADEQQKKEKINYRSLARGITRLKQIRTARILIATEGTPEWEQDLDPETDIQALYVHFNNACRP